jgi:aldehyde dehydrogenase (NAD+)
MDNIQNEITRVFELQRANRWKVAETTAVERIGKLKHLRALIEAKTPLIQKAIYEDFRKNPAESDLTEIIPAISEIKHTIAHLVSWMKPVRVPTPLSLFGTRSEYRHEPKGMVLILSPWNYPFNLTITPLTSAIAAGNCVIVKPSSKTPKTSAMMKALLAEVFPENEVAFFEGNSLVSDALLELPFDHIFFTGSPSVGKKIMVAAAKNLASVTLELGGKSPVIVDETADPRTAAERILWGKFINAGQTCVAPDYILMHESIVDNFVTIARQVIAARFGASIASQSESPDFCRIVTVSKARELEMLIDKSIAAGAQVAFGGKAAPDERFVAPTMLTHVHNDSPIMQNEIFGPILPVISFHTLDEAIEIIHRREKPLALYIFSQSHANIEKILGETTAGGTCVNSLIMHLANGNLPFGGIGNSGMGNYHGHFGFVTFSHQRAVLTQGWPDLLKMVYPPYTAWVKKCIQSSRRIG